jgi:hypothetical protein
MDAKIVATIDGKHYVFARDVEKAYFVGSPWALNWEVHFGLVRGLRHRVGGGKMRVLLDLEDAKIIADLCATLARTNVPPASWRGVCCDYFAVRAGWESWGAAWNADHRSKAA